jgi:F-type H+-transporting ATPase subunit delta
VASNNRSSGTAAFRYASALVDLANEAGAIPQIENDVAALSAMIASCADLRAMIASPLIPVRAQQEALAAIAQKAGFSALVSNFLMVLAHNRRLPELAQILKAVESNLSSRRGEMRASVQSAAPLSAAQIKDLQDALSKTIGQPVAMDASINPALIGGVSITLGSLLIDDSIQTKLNRMARAMKSDVKAA